MIRRARLIFFALIGVAAVFVLPAHLLRANHDVASPYLETDQVEHLMELTYRTCFGHGADLNGLRAEANARGWKAASDRELKRHESAVSEMIGGWVFTDEFGSFAITQSKFKEGPSAYICSLTAKLPFDRHDQVKASFERRFAAALAQEADRSGKHIDRFLMTSPHERPIDASIVYVRSKGALTINMVHGRSSSEAAALPLRGREPPEFQAIAGGQIDHLMELAYQSCFRHGADVAGLQGQALKRGWKTASETEFLRHETARSRIIAGWVFIDAFGGGAVIQSMSKDVPPVYRCSITAQLASGQHDRVKEIFERRFATRLSEEVDRPNQHIDRFWVKGPRRTTIHATLLYITSKRSLTIWLEHGRDRGHLRDHRV